jgi:hypothetical protein
MAFQFPYNGKNFIGQHAGDAAATAWVLANLWDTTNDGMGTPQEGMMYFDTVAHQMNFWDGSAWANYASEIEGGIYVDEVNGSDVGGDGTISRPYATLSHACSTLAYPTTVAEWMTPVTFHLGAGVYAGPITIPQRMHVKVVGDNCIITGEIYWDINPQVWADWGAPLPNTPVLHFARSSGPVIAEQDEEAGAELTYPQGFRLRDGTLYASNSNAVGAHAMPDFHTLALTGVYRDNYRIYNVPAGTGAVIDATKDMYLVLRDSGSSTNVAASRIIGEVDRDVTPGFEVLTENAVIINAIRSTAYMNGVCRIELIEDCLYGAAWNVNAAGGPYDYGLICGDGKTGGNLGGHIRNSTLILNSYFGFDSAAILPIPKHTHADAIVFDRDSLMQMARICTSLPTSFAGFGAALASDAFGRGWWFGHEEQISNYARLTIPCSDSTSAWALFDHTYANAHHFTPNLGVLSASNRLTIELESGIYTMPKADFAFEYDFINVVGKGSASMRGTSPNVLIDCGTQETTWSAEYASLESLTIMESSAALAEEYCLLMKEDAVGCTFKDLHFVASPLSAGTVLAVAVDPGLGANPLLGTWEDCYTTLDGFLYGGVVGSICTRCIAGAYSFGGWHGIAAATVECTGTFTDCVGGNYSFGATDVGGNAKFNKGSATRCRVSGYGFGHTSGGGGPAYTAECSGTLIDCENWSTGGSQSFGASTTGAAVCSATMLRCSAGHSSFGCSADASSVGAFTGDARDCEASHNSFGSNAVDPLYGEFSGVARHCKATYQSFGGTGLFSGTAIDCDATYGSFGIAKVTTKGRMDRCRVTDIRAAAGSGPPTIWGGTVMNCYLATKSGENVQPLMLAGGTVGANSESRVYNCDLYTDTAASSIDTTTGNVYDAQIAHCRMNKDISANVNNVLGDPHNMVDAAYNPT